MTKKAVSEVPAIFLQEFRTQNSDGQLVEG